MNSQVSVQSDPAPEPRNLPGRPERLVIAERIAERWNALGIEYAVLHGLESYPRDLGRDLDVLIEPGRVDAALAVAAKEMRRQGWTTLLETRSVTRSIIGFSPEGASHLEIDSVGKLLWRTVAFCSSPRPALQNGPFRIDPWASAVKRVIMPFLSEGGSRFAKRPGEQRLTAAEEQEVRRRLPAVVTGFDVPALLSQLQQGDVAGLESYQEPLKQSLLQRSFFRPIATARAVLWWLGRLAGGFVRPAGPIVVVAFDDEAEGQSILDEAVSRLSSVFTGIVSRKPASIEGPGGRQAITLLLRAHLVHWQAVRLARFQRAVILEGHPLLGIARSFAKGRRPSLLRRLVIKLVPKPDLFVLVGDKGAGSEGDVAGLRIVHCEVEDAAAEIPAYVLEAFVRKNPLSV